MNEVAIHEASHCAAAIMHGRWVDHTWRLVGHSLPGEMRGHARIPIDDRVEASQMVVALIGYMSTGAPDWPPKYEDACTEKLEALRRITRLR